jgi:hypothetical protein
MKTYQTYPLQHRQELDDFVKFLQTENVKSYLEIGCKYGGTLWAIGNRLPKGSRIVAVDLPAGQNIPGSRINVRPSLEECVKHLKLIQYDVHLCIGDSTSSRIVNEVKALGPFDACLIDANHTLPYVTKDWENYGPMARIVCFHDIGFSRPPGHVQLGLNIDVPILWKQIKDQFRHQEIRHDKQDNGIGILWH